MDIDFVPTSTLYTTLTSTVLPRAINMERVALVIPQWEATPCDNAVPPIEEGTSKAHHRAVAARLPRDFDALRKEIGTGNLRPFLASLADVLLTPDALSSVGVSMQVGINRSNHGCGPNSKRLMRRRFPGGVQLNGYVPWMSGSTRFQGSGILALDQRFMMRRDHSMYGGLGTMWEPYVGPVVCL